MPAIVTIQAPNQPPMCGGPGGLPAIRKRRYLDAKADVNTHLALGEKESGHAQEDRHPGRHEPRINDSVL